MKIIDGKLLAANLRAEIASGVAKLKEEKGIVPGLAVILVGNNPASVSYVTAKEKACVESGMYSREIRLPETTTQDELVNLVKELNVDPAIHGILVQLPVPKHISDKAVIDAIAPEKDVDGFTPINVGKMLIGEECFLPCTPHGIIKLIEFSGMDIKGKHAVVIGRSNIVGKPVAVLLARKETNATVTLCHTGTPDIAAFTKQADVVVVDPPRKGLNADTIEALARFAPRRIVYVSCDPATLARDVALLKERGYRLQNAMAADLFPRCAHVESVVTLSKGEIDCETVMVDFS